MLSISLCHSFYEQDYCKSNQLISLKRGVMIRPANRKKNLLTFIGDAVPDTDSGLPFHFLLHCGIGDLRFLSIFFICHLPIFMTLGNMTDSDKINPEI